jgi:hypothetical protein
MAILKSGSREDSVMRPMKVFWERGVLNVRKLQQIIQKKKKKIAEHSCE